MTSPSSLTAVALVALLSILGPHSWGAFAEDYPPQEFSLQHNCMLHGSRSDGPNTCMNVVKRANTVCFKTGLESEEKCTSTNPYPNSNCGYGTIKKKKNARCPACRCKVVITSRKEGGYDCGIASYDDACTPSQNQ